MSNRDGLLAYEDFFDQEPGNLLALSDFQAVSRRAESFAKLSQRFHQAHIPGLIGRRLLPAKVVRTGPLFPVGVAPACDGAVVPT